MQLNLIELKEDTVRLSDRGRLLGNEIFAEFVIDA
jgi:coproporphyrinogen III oxidase-like Fe-S oxidoreductase